MDNLILAGVNPMNVDYIFFTHLHFDHIATYGYYIISSWISGCKKPFEVLGPPGTVEMSNGAIEGMHKMDVEFVKKRVRDPQPMKALPEPPVNVKEIAQGIVLETDNLKVTATETPHLRSLGKKSFAFRVDSRYGSVVISGDTGPTEEVTELAKGVDLLIHECTFPPDGMVVGGSFSQRAKPSTGHTGPEELGKLAQQAGVKKCVPTHMGPYTSPHAAIEMSKPYLGTPVGPEIWMELAAAIKKHYQGPVVLAEDAMVFEIS
jgi:ribonuclease Z